MAATANTPPVPGLGTQVQEQGVYGYAPEATVEVTWQTQDGQYPDGTPYSLRSPQLLITRRDGTPLTEAISTGERERRWVSGWVNEWMSGWVKGRFRV